jgi:phytol kinase
MVQIILSVILIFVLLVVSELWWRTGRIHGELSRKFVHITVGSFVAFWPFFMTKYEILGLSAAFIIVVSLSKKLQVFTAIHSVQRPTWGEVLFGFAVGLTAVITPSKWGYTLALLHMSLADGLAAIIGVRYGMKNRYLVLGSPKSWVGTATFFVVSLILFAGYCSVTGAGFSLWYVGIALVAAALENVAVRGFDNLVVPLAVALSLRFL